MEQWKDFSKFTEKQLHAYFHSGMIEDFYLCHEVKGICAINHPLLESDIVIADYLCFPRQHLVDAGFAEVWFAVEIKKCGNHIGKGLGQSVAYMQSEFKIKDKLIVPTFSAIWIPQLFNPNADRTATMIDYEKQDAFLKGQYAALGYLNVGSFNIQQGQRATLWELNFYSHHRYCAKFPDRYHMPKQNKDSFFFTHGSRSTIDRSCPKYGF